MSNQAFDFGRPFDADVYDKEYFESGDKSAYSSYQDAQGIVRDQFSVIAEIMDDIKGTALDLGCAYGYGVSELSTRGWKATGVDVSPWAIKKAQELHQDDENTNFMVGDVASLNFWQKSVPQKKKYDLITGSELLEHIDTQDVPTMLTQMAKHGKWGFFVVNARTNPDQDKMSTAGDHGHLNNHTVTWWMNEFGKVGVLDHDRMFYTNKMFEEYEKDRKINVHWYCRAIVVKFDD